MTANPFINRLLKQLKKDLSATVKLLFLIIIFLLILNFFSPKKKAAIDDDVKTKEKTITVNEQMFQYYDHIFFDSNTFIKTYPFFQKDLRSENGFILGPGTVNINDNLIIGKNLTVTIRPGTTVKIAPQKSIIAYGTLIAKGSSSLPIHFVSQNINSFGVVAVINEKSADSLFENVIFENGSEAFINGAIYTGTLSIYHSKADVKNGTFKNARGDDGLNIKYSTGLVENSFFLNNSTDGLDIDYSNLKISHNQFINNGNDALDISGERPIISGNTIKNAGDKCISVGENSQAIIVNNKVSYCQIGIAVKDLSTPTIVNNQILNNKTGIAIYQKKEIFGGGHPKIVASIIYFNDQNITLDKLSTIDISYSNIQGGFVGENNIDQIPFQSSAPIFINRQELPIEELIKQLLPVNININ